ncbi:MAG: hypothetical protein GWP59_01295 [Chlamydiales bacterium]|nr:hypothetical protein [Chlamydiales bacterium]NCF70313.1 hypothetical protein [Chlamydiales bacterium]
MKRQRMLPINTSLRFIFLSILLCTGIPTLIWLSYQNHLKSLSLDPSYNIQAIVQTGPEKEALKTAFFAEQLGLASDVSVNLIQFDTSMAEKKLLSWPFIKEVKVKKVQPETIYIDYTVKEPMAELVDFTNTVINSEGSIFPLTPFFSPKQLPKVYLGLFEERDRGHEVDPMQHLQQEQILLILDLLKELEKRGVDVKFIDLSQAFASSLGKKEIVVELEDYNIVEEGDKAYRENYPKILRLNSSEFVKNLDDFLLVADYLREEAKKQHKNADRLNHPLLVLDLRVGDLAFLSFPKKNLLLEDRKIL